LYWQVCSKDVTGIYGEWSEVVTLTKRPYLVGENGLAGGIVFYDKGEYCDGWRYLEAWTSDEEGTYQWKTSQTTTPGTSAEIVTGYENTYNALYSHVHPAAAAVRDATHGGYDDWFLSSKDELDLLYLVRFAVGGFGSTYDWSSSESGSYIAWGQYFTIGSQSAIIKSYHTVDCRNPASAASASE
jgi:hypothetical protein